MNLLISIGILILSYGLGALSFTHLIKHQSPSKINLLKPNEWLFLKWDILSFILDFLKAYAFLFVLKTYFVSNISLEWLNAYAFFLCIAHFYPFLFFSQGSQTTASLLGVIAVFDPSTGLLGLLIYAFALFLFNRVAQASLLTGAVLLFISQQSILPLFFFLNILLFILLSVKHHHALGIWYRKFSGKPQKRIRRKKA